MFDVDEMVDKTLQSWVVKEEESIKPTILINDIDDTDMYKYAVSALVAFNERDPANPVIFSSGGALCRFAQTEEDGTVIRQLTVPILRKIMAESALWIEEHQTKKGGTTRAVRPPPERIAQGMLDY